MSLREAKRFAMPFRITARTILISGWSSVPAAFIALSAVSITTRPPFMSLTARTRRDVAVGAGNDQYRWKLLDGSKTIRVPDKQQPLAHFPDPPGQGCSATRSPARPSTACIGSQCVLNPRS